MNKKGFSLVEEAFPFMKLVLSATQNGFCVRELDLSVIKKGFSAKSKGLSAVEKVKSLTELVLYAAQIDCLLNNECPFVAN
jgi:hypothetical protein